MAFETIQVSISSVMNAFESPNVKRESGKKQLFLCKHYCREPSLKKSQLSQEELISRSLRGFRRNKVINNKFTTSPSLHKQEKVRELRKNSPCADIKEIASPLLFG